MRLIANGTVQDNLNTVQRKKQQKCNNVNAEHSIHTEKIRKKSFANKCLVPAVVFVRVVPS